MAATFSGFAPSGTQIVARTPCRRAAYAIDWPWFPVEAVTRPRSRSSGVSCETRLIPPRTLNAAVGLWFSCFTHTSAPTASASAG